MANLQTRKQVANLAGVLPQYVGVYINREKLIEIDGYIDTDNPINKDWITKNMMKSSEELKNKKVKTESNNQPPRKPSRQLPKKEIDFESVDLDDIKLGTIDSIKKHREIKRIEVDTELKRIEILKKKAKVLPIDFVVEFADRNTRGIFGETINFAFSQIEQICNDLGANVEIKLRYQRNFKLGFNEILKLGIKKQEPEAMKFAEDYALQSKW